MGKNGGEEMNEWTAIDAHRAKPKAKIEEVG